MCICIVVQCAIYTCQQRSHIISFFQCVHIHNAISNMSKGGSCYHNRLCMSSIEKQFSIFSKQSVSFFPLGILCFSNVIKIIRICNNRDLYPFSSFCNILSFFPPILQIMVIIVRNRNKIQNNLFHTFTYSQNSNMILTLTLPMLH